MTSATTTAARPAPAAPVLIDGDAGHAAQLAAIKAHDSVLDDITQDTIAYFKYTIMAAAAGVPGTGNDFADQVRAFVASRSPKAKAAYLAKAHAMIATLAARQPQFGHYASLEPSAILSQSRADAVKRARGTTFAKAGTLHLDKLSSLAVANDVRLDIKPDAPKAKKPPQDPDTRAGLEYKYLECYLDEVRCVTSTGGLLEGGDDLMLGGVVVGATNKTAEIKQFQVGVDDEFVDGKLFVWTPGKTFHKFPLRTDGVWPAIYSVTIALADKDGGGFGDFLKGLWDKVGAAVSAAIGGAIGTAIGSVIPGLGTVIGAIVGALIGWLVSLFHNEDDIIGSATSNFALGADTKSYYDWAKLTAPEGNRVTLHYKDDGEYRLRIGWRVTKS